MKHKRVTVLMGGTSSERAVSLNSGANVAEALTAAGYAVTTLDVGEDIPALVQDLRDSHPDVVFNALHGRFGEDGCVQGILNLMKIPYTHSGLLASAAAMDKSFARHIFQAEGIPVARGVVVRRGESDDPLPRPYVVKPLNEGSSVGVYIVRDNNNYSPLSDWPFADDRVLVEEFVPGRELTVAVMGDRALGALEITSDRGFYDYEAKYSPGGSRHIVPAPVPQAIYDRACALGVAAHQALGCRGVSRADLRYDDSGAEPRLVVLEVNTQPGMTSVSLVPDIAAYVGIGFQDLVAWMVEQAQCDL